MGTSGHSSAGFSRWRALTEAVRSRESGANLRLRKEFGRGLELVLHRQVPSKDLANVIDKVLGNVTLAIEFGGLTCPDLLPSLVRQAAREVIPSRSPPIEQGMGATPLNAMLQKLLRQLPQNEREALEMVYLDGADDDTVCALKGLNLKELGAIRTSVRERYMMTSSGRWSKATHQ
jgi:hypothetical protein